MQKRRAHRVNPYTEVYPACVASLVGVGLICMLLEAVTMGTLCVVTGIVFGIFCSSSRFATLRRAVSHVDQ